MCRRLRLRQLSRFYSFFHPKINRETDETDQDRPQAAVEVCDERADKDKQ